jgi:sigma-B regulation protein RsbQ
METIVKRNNIRFKRNGKKTMMLVHGYGCDQNMWRFITPAFESDYQIVLLDLTGSGNSDTSQYDFKKYNSLQGYADDIIEICEMLNLEKVTFVGHSVSAMIGALASIKAPNRFENLIMICPSPRYINDKDYIGGFSQQDIDELLDSVESNYLGWSSFIAPVIMANSEKPELSDELANSFCRNHPKIAQHFAKVTFLSDNRADLPKITTPTLILQCSSDVIAPQVVGNYVHHHIQNSILYLMEATGHCPHLSSPKETILLIKRYLQNI